MFDTEGKEYSYSGAVLNVNDSLSYIQTNKDDKINENNRLVKTNP